MGIDVDNLIEEVLNLNMVSFIILKFIIKSFC